MILTFATYKDNGNRIEFHNNQDGSLYIEISYNDVEIPFGFFITKEDKDELMQYLTTKKS